MMERWSEDAPPVLTVRSGIRWAGGRGRRMPRNGMSRTLPWLAMVALLAGGVYQLR
ncbi:hypothetical protein BH24ACT18_BH24ACT18_11570 [soil metagenome]